MIAVAALAAPRLPLPNPWVADPGCAFAPSGPVHWLGCDALGRDVASNLLWGARRSLAVAGFSTIAAMLLGGVLGLVGGMYGRLVAAVTVGPVERVAVMPAILVVLLGLTLLPRGLPTLVALIALTNLPRFARLAWARTVAIAGHDHVRALRGLGLSRPRIIVSTILPDLRLALLSEAARAAAGAVALDAALSFLSLTGSSHRPSWGTMIADARLTASQAPWLLIWPAAALTLTCLLLLMTANALRPRGVVHAIGPYRTVPHAVGPRLTDPGSVLELRSLTIAIAAQGGLTYALRDVSIRVGTAEIVALVGERGSGLDLIGSAVMGVLPPAARVVTGSAWLRGRDLLRLNRAAMRRVRGADVGIVFANPTNSLNPVHRIGRQVEEAVGIHRGLAPRTARRRSLEVLERVGLADPDRHVHERPDRLTASARWRVALAIALANNPPLLIVEDPGGWLDPAETASLLDLLNDLRRERRLSVLVLTRFLRSAVRIADRTGVLYAGELVEDGPTDAVLRQPRHPYTAGLRADLVRPVGLPGAAPSAELLPPGCAFAPRCRHVIALCEQERPQLVESAAGHRTRCLRWSEI